MDGGIDTFESNVEIRLAGFLRINRLATPRFSLRGKAKVERAASTSPEIARFQALMTLKEMNLVGRVLGAKIKLSLSPTQESKGIVEGRADPRSLDPTQPDPTGTLKSRFDVYVEITTPQGTMYNKEPLSMKAKLRSVPPGWAKYKQSIPSTTLFDKAMDALTADIVNATLTVKLVSSKPLPTVAPVDSKPLPAGEAIGTSPIEPEANVTAQAEKAAEGPPQ